MYIWIHDKYSSTSFKQRLWQRKIVLISQINSSNHVCHCGAVVKELLARADKPGSTPGDDVFCFFVPCFFFLLFFFWPFFFSCPVLNTIFPFGIFFFILTADPAGHALGSIYILSLSPEYYFGKGISRVLDLHTGQAYGQKKPQAVNLCPLSSQTAAIFSMLVDIMTNNTQYTRRLY